jgi:hypothetical protein
MPRLIRGWDRGSVDEMAFFDADDSAAWGTWADRVADEWPEATLLQLLVLSERGSFDGDVMPEAGEE